MSAPFAAIVFDFDGVILESVDIKTDAFGALFADEPEHVDAIIELHLRNTGVSRYDKFDTIYRDMLHRELDDPEMKRLDARFAELVFERILRCAFVPGAAEFLEAVHATTPLYVASATPQDELRRIAGARDLSRYFRGVYGSPASKAEIVRRVLADNALSPDEVVFVGDAESDARAAAESGVAFVGRVPPGAPNPFAPGVPVVGDLHELRVWWSTVSTG